MRAIVIILAMVITKVTTDLILTYANKAYNVSDTIPVAAGSHIQLTFECDDGDLSCQLELNGVPIGTYRCGMCIKNCTIRLHDHDLLSRGSNRFDLKCDLTYLSNETQIDTANFALLIFAPNLVTNSEKQGAVFGDRLSCGTERPLPDPFKITGWWWTTAKDHKTIVENGKVMEVAVTGEYVCHVTMVALVNGQKVEYSFVSKPIHGEMAKLSPVAIAAITVAGIVILLAIVLVLIYCTKSMKMSTISTRKTAVGAIQTPREERQRQAALMQKQMWMQQLQILQQGRLRQEHKNADLRALLQDRTNTLNYVELKRETARLISMRPQAQRVIDDGPVKSVSEIKDRQDIIDYIRGIADEKREDVEVKQRGLIEAASGCRSEKITIRTDTCVELKAKKPTSGRLHMNRIKDYYDHDLLICQAPLPKQFAEQWQAIWENAVGVVVWIGAFVEGLSTKIDPYISLKEGGRVICGQYHIQTIFTVKIESEFDVYRVSIRSGNSQDTREIIFLHVHMWPDHAVPKEPAQLADLVLQIQGHQLKQSEYKLPTVLVHCSLGVQRSPAFFAAYIGSQMLYEERRVNLLGIMRYIRRRRWRAFGYGDPFAQVQIVFGVMQVIAMRQQMEGIANLAVAAEEERVFDTKARAAEGKSTLSFVTEKLA